MSWCPDCQHCQELADHEEPDPDPDYWVTATAIAEMIQGHDLAVDFKEGACIEWEEQEPSPPVPVIEMDHEVIYAVVTPERQEGDDKMLYLSDGDAGYIERHVQRFRVTVERVTYE